MILLSNEFDNNLLSIKKKLKYNEHFSFVPIKYNNSDLIIQTPKLYSEYGINNKYKTKYIDLSFINIENDSNIQKFIEILNAIYLKINKKYKRKSFLKVYNDNKYIRLKILNNAIIYDERKNKINNINPNTYGNYIIYLYGLWIKDGIISYQWNLLQAKINIPFYLSSYAFIDEINKNIPPPPPLPPPSVSKKYIPKKVKKNSINKLIQENKLYLPPSLDEISKVLLQFKKNKKSNV